jgi:tRNA/rRNA methyltransferase
VKNGWGAAGDAGGDNSGILPVPMRTRFILINTSHAGNVGAAARAMKTMGFDDLVLVAPRWANVLRREETIQRASGALDVLAKCRIVDTLDDALEGMTHLCATAMTPRDFGPPTVAPREHFEALSKSEREKYIARGSGADFTNVLAPDAAPQAENLAQQGVGFLFGSERFGMRNEDVYRCHVALSIPSNPQFGSLNIGAAIQVIAYEWRLALGGFVPAVAAGPGGAQPVVPATGSPMSGAMADAAQVAGMLTHLEQSLVALGFLDPAAPKKLMPRLNQLFNRAEVTQEEIHILRGIAKAILQQSGQKGEPKPG